jgi:ArsR family transcriptional regulator
VSKVSAPENLEALRKFKADVFQVLAHPTRIHIVETLRSGELSVGAILERVNVEPSTLSQHLSVLRLKNLVLTRKEGNQVLYSLRDPLLIEVLDTMRRYFQRHVEEAIEMLKSMDDDR